MCAKVPSAQDTMFDVSVDNHGGDDAFVHARIYV